MYVKKLLLTFFLTINFYSLSFSQEICGTPVMVNQKSQTFTSNNGVNENTVICLNVFFHIIRDNNGNGGINSNDLDEIIDNLNNFYNSQNIFFVDTGFGFINNTDFLNINNANEAESLSQINNNSNAINYYIVETLWNTSTGFITGTAIEIPSNNLVIRRDRVLTSTSSHEVGHCLNLIHTFQGTAAGTSGCAEAINGSNCSTCGDEICDTPADANTGNSGGYTPDLTNIMSYYNNRNHFTHGQSSRMKNSVLSINKLSQTISNSCTIPELTGANGICSESTYTYTLQNPPSSFNWSTSSNLETVSSMGSSITVKAKYSTSRGDGFITANYNNGAEATKEIFIRKPYAYADAVDPICTNQYSQEYTLKASPGATSYRLVSTSPNLTINFSNEVSFTDAPKTVYFSSTSDGYYQVNLYTTNDCGTTQGIIYVRSESCTGGGGGIYSVYPNPASSEVNIVSNTDKTTAKPESQSLLYQQTSQIAKLYDFNGAFVKDIELNPYGTTKMDVSNLKEGLYFLKIRVREEEETYKIIVAH